MTVRVITLPNGRQCRLGTYTRAWRELLRITADNPRATIKGWEWYPVDARDVLRDMRYGLQDRINHHIPGYGCGHRWDADYQIRLWRDSRRLQDLAARVRVYQFETDEARSRFSHLLATRED